MGNSAVNVELVEEPARRIDDYAEAIHARDDEQDEPGEHEHDQEDADDDSEDAVAWLEDTYGLSSEQLTATLEQLDEAEAQEVLVALNELCLEGHSPEEAERLLLQQYGDQDGDKDAGEEGVEDEGDDADEE